LYQLVLIFVFFSAQTGVPEKNLVVEYDYKFRTETGCYLSGNHELRQMRNTGLFEFLDQFDRKPHIYIRCDNVID